MNRIQYAVIAIIGGGIIMTQKAISIKTAEEIVKTQQRIDKLTEHLQYYSSNKMDGNMFDIRKLSDSRHYEIRWMIDYLSDDDRKAIDRYVVGKFKKAIRDSKVRLKELGVR
jgi:hypothetical protein